MCSFGVRRCHQQRLQLLASVDVKQRCAYVGGRWQSEGPAHAATGRWRGHCGQQGAAQQQQPQQHAQHGLAAELVALQSMLKPLQVAQQLAAFSRKNG